MVELLSGVAVSALRHAMGQEFYLLAFAGNAQHGMARTEARGANIRAQYAGTAAVENYKRA